MSGTIALYTNWFLLKQRPHHFVEAANRCGWRVEVYAVHGVLDHAPALAVPNRLNAALRLPFDRVPVIHAANRASIERIHAAWAAADADLHVYATAPCDDLRRVPRRLVYDCMDEWSEFEGADPAIARREHALASAAHRIWATSRQIESNLRAKYGEKVEFVPNGVEFEHFAPVPAARAARSPTTAVLGYMGAIASWFDEELVRAVADLLPNWEIRLVGPVTLDPARRARLEHSRIRLLGKRPYDSLPAELAQFDVGMIPFQLTKLILGTNPVKLYEYLAAGLPVVATPMPEVEAFSEPGVARCASTAADFARTVRELRDSDAVARRQEIARGHGWTARFRDALRSASDRT